MDPRAVHAPAAYGALCRLEADVRAGVPADLVGTARRRVAMALGLEQWVPFDGAVEELRRGMKPGPYERSFLGFGVNQTEEQRVWQSKSSRIIPYTTILKSYFVPLWFCGVVFSILPLVHFPRIIRRFRRRRLGLCLHCGYDLRASPDKCPECGHAPA